MNTIDIPDQKHPPHIQLLLDELNKHIPCDCFINIIWSEGYALANIKQNHIEITQVHYLHKDTIIYYSDPNYIQKTTTALINTRSEYDQRDRERHNK